MVSLQALALLRPRRGLDDRFTSRVRQGHVKRESPAPPAAQEGLLSGVLNWTPLAEISRLIASPAFAADFGGPQCVAVSAAQIAVATKYGSIVGYNFHEGVDFILATNEPGEHAVRQPVSCMSFSSDGLHLCAGVGDQILVWNLEGAQNQAVVPPLDRIQCGATEVWFIGRLTNLLLSLDESGSLFFHYAFTKFFRRYHRSQRLLQGKESIVCAMLPIGTSPQLTDEVGLCAVISQTQLSIVSVRSLNGDHNAAFKTHFRISKRENEAKRCLSWYPCVKTNDGIVNAKLAYSWGEKLYVLEINNSSLPKDFLSSIELMKDKDKALARLPMQVTAKWRGSTITSLTWLNSQILAVSHNAQMTFLHYTGRLQEVGTDSNPLYEGLSGLSVLSNCFYVLTEMLLLVGKCLKWADRLLALLAQGDYYGAFLLARNYYSSLNHGQLLLSGLPLNKAQRKALVRPFLVKTMREAVDRIPHNLHGEFLRYSLNTVATLTRDEGGSVSDELSLFLESVHESVDAALFFDTLEGFLLSQDIGNLSPSLFELLVRYYVEEGMGDTLTEIVCVLDTQTLNIDLTLKLCTRYGLDECAIYIWNELLGDYVTPFKSLLKRDGDKSVLYAYLSYILTGRKFPGDDVLEEPRATQAREALCEVLFSSGLNLGAFPILAKLLEIDAVLMFVTLNEFFENSCLNTEQTISRQYVIDALFDIYEINQLKGESAVFFAVFVARNYPKYYQFVRLSESGVELVVRLLCTDNDDLKQECQLALKCLLPVYEVDNDIVLERLKRVRYWDVLFSIYKGRNEYKKALEMWLEMLREGFEGAFSFLAEISNNAERNSLTRFLKENFAEIVGFNMVEAIDLVSRYNPDLHLEILECQDQTLRHRYLGTLLSEERPMPVIIRARLVGEYLRLQYDFSVSPWKDLEEHKSLLANFPAERSALAGFYQSRDAFFCLGIVRSEAGDSGALEALLKGIEQDPNNDIVNFSIDYCKMRGDEDSWTQLVERLVRSQHKDANQGIYRCFREMMQHKSTFVNVLHHVLDSATIENVRNVIQEVLTSYFFERAVNSITLLEMNGGIRHSMQQLKEIRLQGWFLKEKRCVSCDKVVWGAGAPQENLDAYERREPQAFFHLQLKLFKCGHAYHSRCFEAIGGDAECILCGRSSNLGM